MGHTYRGAKSGCKLVTEFDSYSDDGVSAVIGVQHTEVPNLGASWLHFLVVALLMVGVPVLKIEFGPPHAYFGSVWPPQKARKF